MKNTTIVILLIEDDFEDAELIKEMLTEVKWQQYSVEHVQNLAQGLDLLLERNFDVITLDLGFTDSKGLETITALRNQEKHTPVIVVTGLDDEELALKSLEMDVQDYLIKSEITSSILKRSICYSIQRKRIAEELRESEQRFSSFMLNLPSAAWIKDTQGRYVYANAEAERVFSMPLTALLGKTDDEIFPPETARQFRENDQQALAEGVTIQTTEVLRQADGIDHHSIVNKFPLAGPNVKPAYVAGVALDITERKRMEETLRESQRALSTLMSNLPGMAYRCRNDKDWTMEFVSEGCVELTGYQQAGLVQNRKISYAQLIHPDDRECVWNDVQAALREERPFELVYRISTAAGEEKWVWERGRGIFGPDGELLALEGFITDITERKRMEAELEHYASFPLIDPTPIMEMDADGNVTFCNSAAEKMLGKVECLDSSNPLIPRDLPDILRDLHQEKVRQYRRTVEVGDLVFDEMIYLAPKFNSVRIFAMDITEHRRLEEDRSRLAAIVENSDDAIFSTTLDDIIVDWNEGAEKLYGYTASEIKGRYRSTLVPADRVDEVPQILKKIGRGESIAHFETIRVTKDGRSIPVLVAISPIKDRNGKITGASTIAHDITDSKRAEQALRESEERFRAIFEQAAVGIGEVSPDRHWLRVNRKLCEIVGYTEEELKTLSIRDITHPDDLETSVEHYQQLLEGKLGNYILEKRYIRKDGSIVWVNVTVSAVSDAGGNLKFAVGIIEDITDKKRAKEEIERLNSVLEAANLELEAFNYTVAHDLRNPLNVISSYCQVFKELCGDQVPEECMGYIQETYDGALRMNRLIEALLKFSQLAHVELHRETVDLTGMARTLAEELKLAETGRRAEFRIADGIAANADASMLRVVMDNLLGNAWKYTGKREETVIELGATEIDSQPVYFVRDNGAGFDKADVDKLFAPFQRLPGAEEFKGFGIGLATVERIIHRHGGRVWAEGQPGKGATFYFTLSTDGVSTKFR